MTRDAWHIHSDQGRYVLARQWPPRFDVAAETVVPALRRGRLAQQVRQDMWRALRGLRGFSPVIEIVTNCGGLSLRAGGRVSPGTGTAEIARRIQTVLDDPARRARWFSFARLTETPPCAR